MYKGGIPLQILAGNIVTLKRVSIKLTKILVGYHLTFRQLA